MGKFLVTCFGVALSISVVLGLGQRNYIRAKRGAAYAGGHPGNGYGVGGVGIPGLTNVIQYTAYNNLLRQGSGHSSGYGSSGHGRKLTVDQAIGMFGHHTLSNSYPYTSHDSGGGGYGSSGGSGGGGGYGGGSSGGGGGYSGGSSGGGGGSSGGGGGSGGYGGK